MFYFIFFTLFFYFHVSEVKSLLKAYIITMFYK